MNKETREEWYKRNDVQSNLIPCIMRREVCFLQPKGGSSNKSYPVRCIKAHHSSYLLRNMEAFDFFNREYNLYHSIFTLDNMPMFSFHPVKRKEQQVAFFGKYDEYVLNCDYVMDFDGVGHNRKEMVESARRAVMKISEYLQRKQVRHAVIYSGSKGFHLEVRGLPPTNGTHQERLKMFRELAIMLGKKYDIPVMEKSDDVGVIDATIYTTTRIWKAPYSYDVKTDTIVYPLTHEQLKMFEMNDYTAEALFSQNHFVRGLVERNGNPQNIFKVYDELVVEEELQDA